MTQQQIDIHNLKICVNAYYSTLNTESDILANADIVDARKLTETNKRLDTLADLYNRLTDYEKEMKDNA